MHEQTCKPSSVLLKRSGSHLSRAPVAWLLQRLIPEGFGGQRHLPPIQSCSGWGLPSRPVTRPLVRFYRTVAPLPWGKQMFCPGGLFLWHYPWGRPHWALPSTLPCGARTFLGSHTYPRDCLVYSCKLLSTLLLLF
jgi:hypothetical protein